MIDKECINVRYWLLEPTMQTLAAREARANLYRLMDQTAESHQPIVISGKRSSAVLVAAEDWQAIQETLFLLSVPGLRESIKAGMTESLAESSEVLKWCAGPCATPKQPRKMRKKFAASGLKPKAQALLAVIAIDPFQNPPPY